MTNFFGSYILVVEGITMPFKTMRASHSFAGINHHINLAILLDDDIYVQSHLF